MTTGGWNWPEARKVILPWMGGKRRQMQRIVSYFPEVSELVSPFLGGGSIEQACASNGVRVAAADADRWLVNYWHWLLADSEGLARIVRERYLYSMGREMYDELAAEYKRGGLCEGLHDAARYLVFSLLTWGSRMRSPSYDGSWDSIITARAEERGWEDMQVDIAGLEGPRTWKTMYKLNPARVRRIEATKLPLLTVECSQWRPFLDRHPATFAYLDPPYYGSADYTHNVDQAELAAYLRGRDWWVMSNADCEEVRDLYAGYEMVCHTESKTLMGWQGGVSERQSTFRDLLVLSDAAYALQRSTFGPVQAKIFAGGA